MLECNANNKEKAASCNVCVIKWIMFHVGDCIGYLGFGDEVFRVSG